MKASWWVGSGSLSGSPWSYKDAAGCLEGPSIEYLTGGEARHEINLLRSRLSERKIASARRHK